MVLESFDEVEAPLRVDSDVDVDVESLEDVDVRVRGAAAMTGESNAPCMAVEADVVGVEVLPSAPHALEMGSDSRG